MSLFDRIGNRGQAPQMQQVQSDPINMARQAGYNIPENLAGDPQAMVMHLIQSGQVANPMLQRIMPMIQRMTGK